MAARADLASESTSGSEAMKTDAWSRIGAGSSGRRRWSSIHRIIAAVGLSLLPWSGAASQCDANEYWLRPESGTSVLDNTQLPVGANAPADRALRPIIAIDAYLRSDLSLRLIVPIAVSKCAEPQARCPEGTLSSWAVTMGRFDRVVVGSDSDSVGDTP